jgi:hypothetical protein
MRDPRVFGPFFSFLGQVQENVEAREIGVTVGNSLDYGLRLLTL